ncbi:hypothetical protein pb186bvf_021146 [Paramecium bursaria]
MNPIQDDQGRSQIEFIFEMQQKILYDLKQELNQWELNTQYTQQLYQQQKSNQQSIQIKKCDEYFENKLSINYSLDTKDLKFEKLKATNHILNMQTQISCVRNEINNLRQIYMQTFAKLQDNFLQRNVQQDNHQLRDQKHEQIIQNRDQEVAKQLMENQKIEEVIVLKEFHENQRSITFVKPDQQDQYGSDSDLQDYYEQNFFPTNHINNQLKVSQNQSLILIQLDCRSQLYSKLQPQIDLLTEKEKLNENRVIKDYQSIDMIDQINEINQCLEQRYDDVKKNQFIARFVNIIEYFYKKQAIYSIKTLNKPAFKMMFKSTHLNLDSGEKKNQNIFLKRMIRIQQQNRLKKIIYHKKENFSAKNVQDIRKIAKT